MSTDTDDEQTTASIRPSMGVDSGAIESIEPTVVIDATMLTIDQPDINEIINNLEDFVQRPALRNVIYKCRITRDKKGVDRNMYPTYFLHLEKDDVKRVCVLD